MTLEEFKQKAKTDDDWAPGWDATVSYTHLTLPTILLV